MPFGKFRGYEVSELPDDYLRFLSTLDLRPPLRRAVEAELDDRRRQGIRPTPGLSLQQDVQQRLRCGVRR